MRLTALRRPSKNLMLIAASLTMIALMATLRLDAAALTSGVLGQPNPTTAAANVVDGGHMWAPGSVAVDTANGRVYVVDGKNDRVLGYNITDFVSGNPNNARVIIGQTSASLSGCNNGGLGAASLCLVPDDSDTGLPMGSVAVDQSGNLFVADTENNRVLGYGIPSFACSTPPCLISAVAVYGQGNDFHSNLCNVGSTTGPGQGTLCEPRGVAATTGSQAGTTTLYVADSDNNRILVFPNSNTLPTLVLGQADFVSAGSGSGLANLNAPTGVAFDPNLGIVYAADTGNNRVLDYLSPLASGAAANVTLTSTGHGAPALNVPTGVAIDLSSNPFVADTGDSRVVEFPLPFGAATLFLGQGGTFGGDLCNTGAALVGSGDLCLEEGLALDGLNNLFIADTGNNRVVEYIFPYSLLATNLVGQADFHHVAANNAVSGLFMSAQTPGQIAGQVAVDPSGNVYVADTGNSRVLGFAAGSIAGSQPPVPTLIFGQLDTTSVSCNLGNGIGKPPTPTGLCNPAGVAVDSNGNLYVADTNNSRVVEYNTPSFTCATPPCIGLPANLELGHVGNLTSSACNNGVSPAGDGTLCTPMAVALDGSNALYVADTGNNRVLEYNNPFASPRANLVLGQTTFAVTLPNQTGVTTSAGANTLWGPSGVTISNAHIVVSDTNNNRVLVYGVGASDGDPAGVALGQLDLTHNTPNQEAQGATTTPPPSNSTLWGPLGVTVDGSGNIYVADASNQRVVEFATAFSNNEAATAVFGQGGDFSSQACNVEGSGPSQGTLCTPSGVAFDLATTTAQSPNAGNIYIADALNNRVVWAVPGSVSNLSRQHIKTASAGSPSTLTLGRTQIFFGPHKRGSVSKPTLLKLTNTGASQIRLFRIWTVGDFGARSTCGNILLPGQTCSARVTFAPITDGARGGVLTISDDAAGGQHTVALHGSGTH